MDTKIEAVQDECVRQFIRINKGKVHIESEVKEWIDGWCTNAVPFLFPDVSAVTDKIDQEVIYDKIAFKVNIAWDTGDTVTAKDYKKWYLNYISSNLESCKYWPRFDDYQTTEGLPGAVMSTLDDETSTIIDLCGDPNNPNMGQRKGLVMGDVQSGKTMNFTGVINKAADAGYKIIIVLAGTLNSLRSQTQKRIDYGFVGHTVDNKDESKKYVGVSLEPKGNRFEAVSFTTTKKDFSAAYAKQNIASLSSYKEPVIFVIKKNVGLLKKLEGWLKSSEVNKRVLDLFPLLLIDDEADYASIDTKKKNPDTDPTMTNMWIRKVLELFKNHCYLGYTATPFANSFILPGSQDSMESADLFPEDFIHCLKEPSNYFGPNKLFVTNDDGTLNGEYENLFLIEDNEDYENSENSILPTKQPRDFIISELPESMIDAVFCFIISSTIRAIRGDKNKHMSMMINCSPKVVTQDKIKALLDLEFRKIKLSLQANSKIELEKALNCREIMRLKSIYGKYFSTVKESFEDVLGLSYSTVMAIEIRAINGGPNGAPLDYNEDSYPDGRKLIAIGGYALSRGITLEGLSVSYLIRNAAANDTLLQLGRWFGYRDNYSDLCKIFITPVAKSWYARVTEVVSELKDYIKDMRKRDMTPLQFGMAIRNHPGSLLITARNRMRSAITYDQEYNLDGKLVRASYHYKDPKIIDKNTKYCEKLFADLDKNSDYNDHKKEFHGSEETDSCQLYVKVPVEKIHDFLDTFKWHEDAASIKVDAIKEHLENTPEIRHFDIVFISGASKKDKITCGTKEIKRSERKLDLRKSYKGVEYYEIQNRSVTAHGNQMFGLRHNVAKEIGKSDVAARRLRERPLLLIYFNDGSLKPKDEDEQRILFTSYAVSFQGDPLNPRRTVTRNLLVTAEAYERFEQEKSEEQEEFDYGE